MLSWALGAAVGFVSGVLSGAFGIGGGIVTTPAIRLVMGAPALIAVGTPLPVIIPSALTGAWSYHRRGLVDVHAGLVLGLAGSVTAVLGAAAANTVGGRVVLIGTALLILYAAGDTAWQAMHPGAVPADHAQLHEAEEAGVAGPDVTRAPDAGRPAQPGPPARRVWLVGIGVMTGFYSGFFGLGGGFVLVPMLTRWLRLPIKRAIGTSLVAVSILAVPGTVTHAFLGNIDWVIAGGLVLGVIPGALLGAKITLRAQERHVRIAFAILLVGVGAWLAFAELPGVFR